MKKNNTNYNLKAIYKKLVSNDIPQSYVDFVVSHCSVCFLTDEEQQKQANVNFATVYPKLYNRI